MQQSMFNLQNFEFNQLPVAVIVDKTTGNVLFDAANVCDVLDYSRSASDVIENLDDDEKSLLDRSNFDTTFSVVSKGGFQQKWFVTESGLYTLILRSNKPKAKSFRRWVTHEVLPALRKSGTYTTGKDKPDMWKIQRTFSGAKKLALANGMKEIPARLHAAEIVKQTHNVDVFALLGIEPPQEQEQQTYCNNLKHKLHNALDGKIAPADGEYVLIDAVIEYLAGLGITLSRNNELWGYIKSLGFRKIRKQFGTDRVMAIYDAKWGGN